MLCAIRPHGLATPNKDLWTPSIDELLQARVVTAISDGSNFAASGYGAKVNREKMASELTKYIPALKELKERFLNSYNVVIDAYYNAYLAGQTEKETIAAARAKLLPIISAIRAFADDAVLVELGRVYAFQYSALRSKDATLCYKYISGTGDPGKINANIPSDLLQRENSLNARAIATATKRPEVPERVIKSLWRKVGLLVARRVGPEKVKLLADSVPDPSRYSDYCSVWTVLLQEITNNLEPREGGILMRSILGEAIRS